MNRSVFVLLMMTVFYLASWSNAASAYYDPQNGRWLNRDPIVELGGNNVYSSMKNQVVSRVDFLGLICFPWQNCANLPPRYVNRNKPDPKPCTKCSKDKYTNEGIEMMKRGVDPRDVATAALITKRVEAQTNSKSVLSKLGVTKTDPLRHCTWSCWLAMTVGQDNAETITTAHEDCNSNNNEHDRAMDLHNNMIGRMLAGPDTIPEGMRLTFCLQACADMMKATPSPLILD